VGNKLGWIIAGALLLVLVIVIVSLTLITSPSEPTHATRKSGFMELREPSVSLSAVLGAEPSAPGNAADDYAKAVAVYKANERKLSTMRDYRPVMGLLEQMHKHVAAGAQKREMRYVFVHTPEKMEVGFLCEPATYLTNVADAMDLLAKAHVDAGRHEQAAAVLADKLVMGRHMMNERARVHMVRNGILAQAAALDGLLAVYRLTNAPPEKVSAAQNYADALSAMRSFYEDKQRVVWSLKPHPGDIFNVVANEQDRAWKVQAVLALGVVRYTADDSDDARHAEKLLDELVHADDPLVAAAAKAARDLDEAGFNTFTTR